MQTAKRQGMQMMDDAVADLYDRGIITKEDALLHAEDKQNMRAHIGLRR